MHERFQVSVRRACRLARLRNATWYRKSQTALRMRIREIAQARPRFSYERIWIMLRPEGWKDGRNRVHRLYRLEGLQVRMRRRRTKRLSLHHGAVPKPVAANQYWSMDFAHDQLEPTVRYAA